MKAITLHQPWAQLMVTPRPHEHTVANTARNPLTCDTCGAQRNVYGEWVNGRSTTEPMVKWIETRSWAAPKALIGQRIAIHAGAKLAPDPCVLGGYHVRGFGRSGRALEGPGLPKFRSTPRLEGLLLPYGKVVGSGVLTACVPMVEKCNSTSEPRLCLDWSALHLKTEGTEIADQLPFGHFEPGRWAWLFADAVKLDEPIPCRGAQRVWNLPEEIARAFGQ